MSTASQSEDDMSYHDGKSQWDPHDLLSPEEELEAFGMGRPKKARSVSGVSITSVTDRRMRAASAKIRPKFKKVSWNGLNSTFRLFKRTVEGHLLQVGAGYLTNPTFLDMYEKLGEDCLKSDVFWKMFKVSYPQAVSDRSYLYGMLVTATMNMPHKTF